MRNWVLVLLALLLTMSGAALAQDSGTPSVFCGDLSADDCALLEQAQSAGMNVTAAAFDLFVDVQATNNGQNVPISLVGSGSYSGMLNMGGMMSPEMGSMEDALAALRDFSGELQLTFTIPESMSASDSTTNTVMLELRLVDGVGYINFDSLQPLINEPSLSGWGGLDIASLLGALMDQNPNLLSQMGGMTGGIDPMLMARLSDPNFAGEYATITRTDDGSSSFALFETTIDFAGLMADPDFQEMMRTQMEDQMGAMGQPMDEQQMGQAHEMMQQMFQAATFIVRQQIDTTTGLTNSLSVEFDLGSMDMNNRMEVTPEATAESVPGMGGMGMMMGNNTVSMTAMINYRYNDVPTISAPADAAMLPYEQIVGMLGGMMGERNGAMGEGVTPNPPITIVTATPASGTLEAPDPQVTQEATPAG